MNKQKLPKWDTIIAVGLILISLTLAYVLISTSSQTKTVPQLTNNILTFTTNPNTKIDFSGSTITANLSTPQQMEGFNGISINSTAFPEYSTMLTEFQASTPNPNQLFIDEYTNLSERNISYFNVGNTVSISGLELSINYLVSTYSSATLTASSSILNNTLTGSFNFDPNYLSETNGKGPIYLNKVLSQYYFSIKENDFALYKLTLNGGPSNSGFLVINFTKDQPRQSYLLINNNQTNAPPITTSTLEIGGFQSLTLELSSTGSNALTPFNFVRNIEVPPGILPDSKLNVSSASVQVIKSTGNVSDLNGNLSVDSAGGMSIQERPILENGSIVTLMDFYVTTADSTVYVSGHDLSTITIFSESEGTRNFYDIIAGALIGAGIASFYDLVRKVGKK